MNLYAYTRGDPVNFSDPSGLCDWGMNITTQVTTYIDYWSGKHLLFQDAITSLSDSFECLWNTPPFPPGETPPSEGAAIGGASGAGVSPGPGRSQEQPTTPCVLEEPWGDFDVASGEFAWFDPQTALRLSVALSNLNQQGITPVITSGYRSPQKQDELRNSNSPFVITPAKVSWHQVGSAVDFGPNTNAGHFDAIVAAMTNVGFVWGDTFRRRDRPHFQLKPAGTSPSVRLVQSCVHTAAGG